MIEIYANGTLAERVRGAVRKIVPGRKLTPEQAAVRLRGTARNAIEAFNGEVGFAQLTGRWVRYGDLDLGTDEVAFEVSELHAGIPVGDVEIVTFWIDARGTYAFDAPGSYLA